MSPLRRGLAVLVAVLALAAPAAAQVSLEGTWYVLIHYKDSHATHADEERWDDKVWVFEREAQRLKWTEYPIVVFDDETGRFERRSTGQYARILHFWEPSDVQLADIQDGLRVNSRGSKSKSLRGSDASGWGSERRGGASSASVITYSETWTIDTPSTLPVFTRSDTMGGGQTDTLEGVTRYTTREVKEGGALLAGDFERDESRKGSFRMYRSGPVGSLEEKTQEQIQRQAVARGLETDAGARALAAQAVSSQLPVVGLVVSDAEFDALAKETIRLSVSGESNDALAKKLDDSLREKLRAVAPAGGRHDDAARYRWPFESAQPAALKGLADGVHAFALPAGTPVVAARDGVVTRVVDAVAAANAGSWRSNTVYVRHADGSFARYSDLQAGIVVKAGQSVKIGDKLGSSGAVLLFAVERLDGEGRAQPVSIRFAGPTPEGVIAEAGKSYGGR